MALVVVGIVLWGHVVILVGVLELLAQFILPIIEGVGDVIQEDQAQHHVLVNNGIQVGPQLVGGGPELFSRSLKNCCSMGFMALFLMNSAEQ